MTAAMLQKLAEAVCVKGWCAAHTRSGLVSSPAAFCGTGVVGHPSPKGSSLLDVRYDHCQHVCQTVCCLS